MRVTKINGVPTFINAESSNTYGCTWNESTDAYTRTGAISGEATGASPGDAKLPVHARMKRCIVSDAGAVQYYLDPDNSANKLGIAPSVTGTCEAASAFNKVKDTGVFTAANVGVGRIIHNTTVGKTAIYAIVTARDSDNEVTIDTFMHGGLTARCAGVATTDTANKLIASATNFTTSGVTAGDIVRRVSTDRMTVAAIMKCKGVDAANTLSLMDWAGSDYDGFTSGNEKFVIFPEAFSTGDTFEICTAVLDGTDGQVMVEIPKFYYRNTYNSNVHSPSVRLAPWPGYALHPAFIRDGVEVDNRYYSAFEGFNNGGKLRSQLGQFPTVYQTRATFRVYAHAVGTGWRQEDFYLRSAVQLLYLIEYASFNSQSMIGLGATNWGGYWNTYNGYYPVWKTGLSLFKGNKTGNNVSTANTLGNGSYMTYRGIENWYGHIWKWLDGINVISNRAWVSGNETQFADATIANYTDTETNMATSNEYQATLLPLSYGFLCATTGAGTTTKITDYYYQSTGNRVVYVGGGLDSGANAGAFYFDADAASGSAYAYIGGRAVL